MRDNLFFLDIFKWVFGLFVQQPGRFWAVSALFGVLFAAAVLAKARFPKILCWPLLVAFLMWLLFGFLEYDNVVRKANIRIDVVFVWPFFFLGTALLVVVFMVGLVHAVKAANEADRKENEADRSENAADLSPLELIRAIERAKRKRRGNETRRPPLGSPPARPPGLDND